MMISSGGESMHMTMPMTTRTDKIEVRDDTERNVMSPNANILML